MWRYLSSTAGEKGSPRRASAAFRAKRSARSVSKIVWSRSKRTARIEDRGERLLRAIRDESALQVVGGDAHRDAVAGDDADAVLAHLPVQAGQHLVVLTALHLVVAAGQHFRDDALQLDQIFLAHSHSVTREMAHTSLFSRENQKPLCGELQGL